ncbi:MAG TPA: SPOR domain-containing protein [Synergistales bacterium]|nr:SPOR domain-containing protein [Synergistales bacterium]
MSIRESRRHKERRSVIPFGDIMLPVIGLVAVGLLIVGVKLFFLSGDRYKTYTPLPIHQEEKTTPNPSVTPPVLPPGQPEKENAAEDAILAVPVSPGGGTGDRVRVETPTKTPPVVKPKTPPRPPEVKRPAPPPAPSNSRWGVQIGSFTARQSAETVRQQAERAGFRVSILSGQVRGKTYFRVTVPAGNTRAEAVSLSQKLAKSGFPVFVVSIR